MDIPGILLIPGTNGNTLYVTVDYTVRTADKKLANSFTEVNQVITNEVTLGGAAPNNLEPNKLYTLLMHLGLTSVKFQAVVSDWQMYSDSSIDEDGHETGGSTDNEASVWLPSNVVAYTVAKNVEANATDCSFEGASLNIGDVQSGTITGNITNVTKNSTTSTTADITLTANTTTATVSTTTTITYELGKVALTIKQAPVAISVSGIGTSINTSAAQTLTVTNNGTGATIDAANYTVGVYEDSACETAATESAFTYSAGSLTFNTAGTYFVKVTSGESTIKTDGITVTTP